MPGDLEWVNAYHDSPYGRIVCNWRKQEKLLELEIIVPSNTSATVYVPTSDTSRVTVGDVHTSEDMTFQREENGYAIYQVGSGEYHYIVDQQ